MRQTLFNTGSLIVIAALLTTTAPVIAAEDVALEEVVVTAERREESLQRTPISIVALTSKELEQKGITGLIDLRSNVPNLQLTPHPNSAATAQVFMRGVGVNDDQVTQDPSVAVYLDNVYVARSQGLAMDIADLERVEVLRGPQGTLYGRNATGGAINFITKQPVIGDWQFKQNFTFGSRELLTSRTAVNIPLSETVAARVSYMHSSQDGFVANRGTGVARWGDKDRDAVRADVLWKATDDLDVRYVYDYSHIGDTPAFVAAAPLYPAVAPRPTAGSALVNNLLANDVAVQGHSLTATYRVSDALSLKSITAFRKLENFQNGNYLAGVSGALPLFSNRATTDQDQVSQELQALGEYGQFKYIVGGYFFNETGLFSSGTVTIQAPTTESQNRATIANTAYALFGQLTWTPDVLDSRLHLTGGLRWSRDERKATLARFTRTIATGAVVAVPGVGAGDRNFSNVSPTGVISFDVTDDINAYFKVARGYKTGGYNTRASTTAKFNEGFGEETLTSYEVGVKSQFWDDRIRLNAAGFRADYRDVQVNVQSDPLNIRLTDVLNAGAATVQGIEADVSAALGAGLTVSANYAYLDAQYDRITDVTGANVAGNYRFINAPLHSYALNVTYELPPLPIGVLSTNLGYTWQGKKYASSTVTPTSRFIIGSYGVLNARITLSDIPLVEGLRVAAWARNLADKNYYIAHFNVGVPAAIHGEPRSFGLDLVYEY